MKLFDLLFPKFCVGCKKLGSYLCQKCESNISQGELVCPICEKVAIGGKVHPLCKKRYGLDGLWSLGVYQDPLKKIIQKLKYRFVSDLALLLIDLMVRYWAKYTPYFLEEIKKDRGESWIIVPVPLHKKREKWRGFNQSALFGKLLAAKIGLNYQDALIRVKYTKPQVGMISYQRKKNIKNAFSLNTKYDPPAGGHNTNILLIDDVWTTGSTLKECCYTLKRGGAKKVWAITLAR